MKNNNKTYFPFPKVFLCAVALAFSAVGTMGATSPLSKTKAMGAWAEIARVETMYGIPQGLLLSMSLVETGSANSGQLVPWPYTVALNPTALYSFNTKAQAQLKLTKLQRIGFKLVDITIDGTTHKRQRLADAHIHLKKAAAHVSVKIRGKHAPRRFTNHASALQFAQKSVQHGYDNFDIGAMQINWHYHKSNFSGLAAALDPFHNANYAVKYVMKHKESRDWWRSVGRYHSGTKHLAEKYIDRVYTMYQRIHGVRADGAA